MNEKIEPAKRGSPANNPPTTGFTVRNMSVLACALGFTLWHYKGMEFPLSTLKSAGFFDNAVDLINTGDIVMLSAFDGGDLAFIAKSKAPHDRFETVHLAPMGGAK